MNRYIDFKYGYINFFVEVLRFGYHSQLDGQKIVNYQPMNKTTDKKKIHQNSHTIP